MKKENTRYIEIKHLSDAGRANQLAEQCAVEAGFDKNMIREIGLVIYELVANMVVHGGGGTIEIIPLYEKKRKGIQIDCIDDGPGIVDVELAITDGYSTVGSLGYGLGTVNRLVDEFEVTSASEGGTHITCRRWMRIKDPHAKPCPITVGAATRSHPKMKGINGDAFIIKNWNNSVLVALIDGLGHGQWANRAAQTARNYIESHFDQPLEDIFRGVGRICRSTRGVVMALAAFDWEKEKLSYAAIGNIEARVLKSSDEIKLLVRRGIIGYNAPNPLVTEHHWDSCNVMVIFTDGVSNHWQWEDFPGLTEDSATVLAQRLLRALARDEDDATVIVVKGK